MVSWQWGALEALQLWEALSAPGLGNEDPAYAIPGGGENWRQEKAVVVVRLEQWLASVCSSLQSKMLSTVCLVNLGLKT